MDNIVTLATPTTESRLLGDQGIAIVNELGEEGMKQLRMYEADLRAKEVKTPTKVLLRVRATRFSYRERVVKITAQRRTLLVEPA